MREKILGTLPFLVPLIFIPLFPNEYELPKFFFFVLSIQLLLLFSVSRIASHFAHLVQDRIVIISGLFCLILFLADILGLDQRISLIGSNSRYQGFMLALSLFEYIVLLRTYSLRKEFLIKSSLPFAYASTLVLSIITLSQQFMHTILHVLIPIYNGRIVATLGNPNFLGSILAIQLLFLLLHGPTSKKRKVVLLHLALHVLVWLALIVTQSQSAILGLLLGYSLYVFIKTPSLYKKICLLIPIIAVSIITLYSVRSNFSIWDNQLRIWPVALEKIIDRPLLGYGQENFQLIFPEKLHYVVDSAHNILLEIALAGGIPLLIIFTLLIITSLLKHPWQVRILILVALFIAQFNPASISLLVFLWYLIGLTPKGGGKGNVEENLS